MSFWRILGLVAKILAECSIGFGLILFTCTSAVVAELFLAVYHWCERRSRSSMGEKSEHDTGDTG